jgi:nitrogen fixation protein FixH
MRIDMQIKELTREPRVLTGRAVLIWLVAFFAVVFTANGVMMKFALQTMSGTEVDSAYRASLTFNTEAQAARRQDERAWQVSGHAARSADGGAVVRVEARDKAGVPLTGLAFSAALERPTDKRADRRMALAELQSGLYGGKAADVAPGQWDLVLEADRGAERLFVSKTRVFLK